MNKFRAISIALFVSLAGSSLTAEDLSPQQQLKAWGKEFVGTWVNERAMETDVEGLGKKGDKIAVVASIKPLNGVYQITWKTQINGKQTAAGAALVGWDASHKKIRARSFNSRGGSWTTIYTKHGNDWTTKRASVDADGTKGSSVGVIKISKDSHSRKTTNRKLGEETLPDQTVVWKRKK